MKRINHYFSSASLVKLFDKFITIFLVNRPKLFFYFSYTSLFFFFIFQKDSSSVIERNQQNCTNEKKKITKSIKEKSKQIEITKERNDSYKSKKLPKISCFGFIICLLYIYLMYFHRKKNHKQTTSFYITYIMYKWKIYVFKG